jgi:transposase-like protein
MPMATALNVPQFTNEKAAIAHLEASRWPDGAFCPRCGSINVHRMGGKTQAGYFQCNGCRDKFTCRTGTVMERSHIPVHKWLLAIHLMSSNKNGTSAHELSRNLGVSYKSAWFLAHRIREAMLDGKAATMGGNGGQIQSDETYYGNTSKRSKSYRKGLKRKEAVLGIVDPQTGEARAIHMELGVGKDVVGDHIAKNVNRQSVLVTDESALYKKLGKEFIDHQTMLHWCGEYLNKDGFTTNNVENFFGTFKRGMRGTYIHCEPQHLQRYLNEFSFRYSNRSGLGVEDAERADRILKGIEGKRLTY